MVRSQYKILPVFGALAVSMMITACSSSSGQQNAISNLNGSNENNPAVVSNESSSNAASEVSVPHLENAVKAPPSEIPGVYVSEEEAKTRVLDYSGFTEEEISNLKISLEENAETGKYYLVRFSKGDQEFKYKVQAISSVVSPID